MAEVDGSIVAIYHDGNAIINSLDPESVSDDSWVVFMKGCPRWIKELDFTFKFLLEKNPCNI